MNNDHSFQGLGSCAKRRINQIRGHEVQNFLYKLDAIWPYLPKLELQELSFATDYDKKKESGGKHAMQEVSIVGHLRAIGTLNRKRKRRDSEIRRSVAIELGAGTAKLSDRLQKVTNAEMRHVLVDRKQFDSSQTRDRVMKARVPDKIDEEEYVKRLTTDIVSINFENLYDANNEEAFCMSKHLCGPACDLTIKALSGVDKVISNKSSMLTSCVLGTCCHYLCTWDSFCGQECWKSMGLTQNDFEVCATASQWASMKAKREKTLGNQENLKCSLITTNNEENENLSCSFSKNLMESAQEVGEIVLGLALPNFKVSSDEFERTFTRDEKSALGVRCKQLIDFTRSSYLQNIGYKVKLVRYTRLSIEDRLLLAWV